MLAKKFMRKEWGNKRELQKAAKSSLPIQEENAKAFREQLDALTGYDFIREKYKRMEEWEAKYPPYQSLI